MTIITSANATGAAMTAMAQMQAGAAAGTTSLAAAFNVLTPAQIANLAVSKQLSEIQLLEALNTAELGIEKEREIWRSYNAATAKMAEKGATDALAFSMKNLWVACKPFIIIAAITAAATALYKIWEKVNVTAQEQLQIFNDLSNEYESTKSTLDSLKSEYDDVIEKIEELNRIKGLGTLTRSQAEELAMLQTTSDELERKIKLQEKLAELDRQAVNDAAFLALQKRSNEHTGMTMRRGSEVVSSGGGSSMNDIDAIEYYLSKLEEAKKRKDKLDADFADIDSPTENEHIKYDAEATRLETEIRSYETRIGDIVSAVQPLMSAITDTSGPAYDLKVALESVINRWLDVSNAAESAAQSFADTNTTIWTLIPNLATHVTNLNTAEENINKLRDALADFRDDGYVSMDAFEDMFETFGNFPDAFERFVSVASNSKSTMSEVKTAANELAEAYLNSTDFLQSLTDGTIEGTIATLKNIGVANAEEVVLTRVAAAKAENVLAGMDLQDAEWSVAEAELRAAGAAEDEIEALLQLRQTKLRSVIANTNFQTSTAETVGVLIREAKAAGMATNNLAALLDLKNAEASGKLDGTLFSERTEWLKTMEAIVARVQNDVDALITSDLGLELNMTPTPGSGKTAAEKAAEEARDAFEKVYNAKKYELDMERITIEEFYDWLGGQDGYQKYFEAQGETLEDFQKYSKEVFDGRI